MMIINLAIKQLANGKTNHVKIEALNLLETWYKNHTKDFN